MTLGFIIRWLYRSIDTVVVRQTDRQTGRKIHVHVYPVQTRQEHKHVQSFWTMFVLVAIA